MQAVKEYSKSRLRKQIMERSVRERRSAAARGGLVPPTIPRWMGEDNPLTFISREVAIMKKLDHPNVRVGPGLTERGLNRCRLTPFSPAS